MAEVHRLKGSRQSHLDVEADALAPTVAPAATTPAPAAPAPVPAPAISAPVIPLAAPAIALPAPVPAPDMGVEITFEEPAR
jgi:hypothetical protein